MFDYHFGGGGGGGGGVPKVNSIGGLALSVVTAFATTPGAFLTLGLSVPIKMATARSASASVKPTAGSVTTALFTNTACFVTSISSSATNDDTVPPDDTVPTECSWSQSAISSPRLRNDPDAVTEINDGMPCEMRASATLCRFGGINRQEEDRTMEALVVVTTRCRAAMQEGWNHVAATGCVTPSMSRKTIRRCDI